MSCPSSQIYRYDHILGLRDELDTDLFESWGAALARMLPEKSRFVVACDRRKDSDRFKEALIRGLVDRGVHLVDLGAAPTDLAVYGCERIGASGFAVVTGGARSGAWNGLRWNLAESSLSYPEQIQRLRIGADQWTSVSDPDTEREKGTVHSLDISGDWISWLQTVWYDAPRVPFRILLDPMYGSWSRLARQTLQAVFPQMIFEAIHDEPDGNFGDLTPWSRDPKSRAALCTEVDLRRANLGFALDADAGHFSIVDDRGIPLRPEETAWFVLHDLLGEALEGEIFLHDVNCSEILLDEGRRLGGRPIVVARNEQSFIAEMKRTDALIGLSSEGEVFFRGARGNRITVFAVCWALDYLCRLEMSLSELRATFPTFYTTPEIRTPQASLEQVAMRLARFWKTEAQQTFEGIRFTGPNGRVQIRTITDYAQLGFHFEASDRKALQQMVWECSCALDDLDHIGLFLGEQFRGETSA